MALNPKPPVISFYLMWHALLVFIVFMVIDYIYYGLIAPVNPYQQDLVNKIIWTFVLAIMFTQAFHLACCSWWEPVKGKLPPQSMKWVHAKRGITFGLVLGIAFIAVIALSCYIVSVTFIYGLEAFRGIPESGVDDGVLLLKAGIGGLTLEYAGKQEAEGDR